MPKTFSQVFPPSPIFTEKDIGNLGGKVFLITGATSGVGFELAKMLFNAGGTVYIAARSGYKIDHAIKNIQQSTSTNKQGQLHSLKIDLADFSSINPAVTSFLATETRLDILVHNAGVMTPPAGSVNGNGIDLEMSTNCLGPYLLNRLLEPTLIKTAKATQDSSTRIVWLTSMLTASVPQGGIRFKDKTDGEPQVLKNAMQNYMQSKAGNVFLAHETARRLGEKGVISVSVNPGLMKTELQRHNPRIQGIIMSILLKPALYGAYSELFAALSPEITREKNSCFIVPWGRFGELPAHIKDSLRVEEKSEKSGTGKAPAERFVGWCESVTEGYR